MGRSGGESAIIGLVIIIAIIVWAGIILLIVFAACAIVYGIIEIIKYYNKKKRLALEEKEQHEGKLKFLDEEIIYCQNKLASEPSSVYISSYLETLPYKKEIMEGEYLVSHQKMPKNEKNAILTQIEAKKSFLKKHKTIVDYSLPLDVENAYHDTISAINKISSDCTLWKVSSRTQTGYLYFWASNIHRDRVVILKEYYNDVIPADGTDIICIKTGDFKYYFYPEGIIEAKSNTCYTVHNYAQISSILRDVIVVENKTTIKGATNIGYTYLHTRVDGGPDMRYSYNPRYPENKYGYIVLSPISNFNIDISNWNLAQHFHKTINRLQNIAKNNTSRSYSCNIISNDININTDSRIDPQIHTITQSIIKENGIQIIKDKTFISMLDDNHAFKNKEYFKNILKQLQSEGCFEKIISGDSISFDIDELISDISDKYLLEETYVKEIFTYLFKPINSLNQNMDKGL